MLRTVQTLRRTARPLRRATYSTLIPDPLVRNEGDALPPMNQKPPPRSSDEAELSDQEWEIRTGRAIDLIQKTLPNFFETGLVTSIEKATGDPCISSPIPIPVVNSNPLQGHPELEPIYSPHVRLSYTPPTQLPAPFPKTLHIEGFPLYIASSALLRHTLNALYSDTHLVLQKVAVQDPRTNAAPAIPSEARRRREKSITVAFSARGIARVSGAAGQWDVHSTYTFSPATGLVHIHRINSILPAPHQAVYDGLRASLGNVFGSTKHPGETPGTAFREKT